MKNVFLICFLLLIIKPSFSQDWNSSLDVFYEYNRRAALLNTPVIVKANVSLDSLEEFKSISDKLKVYVLPIVSTSTLRNKRSYNSSQDFGLISNPGFQTYLSTGLLLKSKYLFFQFQPEIVFAQNSEYDTYLESFDELAIKSMYHYWNRGDFPQRFGSGVYTKAWWGQSKLTFQYGAFELGAATENIWWGPGQFNALIFSNNAQGFPHLTLNTTKPAKTFLGNFETQLLIGKLTDSGFSPTQYPDLDEMYFKSFSGDSKYLNALMLSYNPKWIPGLYLGFTRTFQQYSKSRGSGFLAYFPVFEGLTKDQYGFDKDENGQDQQISIFGRFVIPKSKSEIYFEFGKRDHAKSWRELTLNPEHARAYILGFVQLFDLPASSKLLQVRGEMTQQQESVNRYIRYSGGPGGLGGGSTWHTHGLSRGFTNYGQPLGVGIGVGSNVQTIELALVDGMDKMGIRFERLANNQDFYYKAQLQETERKPWIDLSIGFLFDKKWDNLLLSSKLQLIRAHNYQWQLAPESTPDFPKGENMNSFLAETSLIYFWNKR